MIRAAGRSVPCTDNSVFFKGRMESKLFFAFGEFPAGRSLLPCTPTLPFSGSILVLSPLCLRCFNCKEAAGFKMEKRS